MYIQDPREYSKVTSDPIHGYIVIPEQILPIVQSRYVQRLRSISQNARAIAAYPTLNGSRYEHALGTMHLSSIAWDVAWQNTWGNESDGSDRESTQGKFAEAVWKSIFAASQSKTLNDYMLSQAYRRIGASPPDDWRAKEFPSIMINAVGVVGLLHDVGHPPFSHILEEPYAEHASKILGEEFVDHYEEYLNDKPDTQFHEYASSQILEQILGDENLSGGISSFIVRTIFEARRADDPDTPSWARCIHELIDGDVDVDRLDYIVRDSRRAGTQFGAIDVERLVGNLELHCIPPEASTEKPESWKIGIGYRAISAVEGLLAQREQSYRWMIFHQKALVSDTCLKRSFSKALEEDWDGNIETFNYVSSWNDEAGATAPSYDVDDHMVTTWLRSVRRRWAQSPSSETPRNLALMRVYDEMSPATSQLGETTESMFMR